MKRVVVLGALITIGALSVAVSAYQAPAAQPKVVQVDKLKDNLYVLKGGGGNTTVFIGANGVTVVDTKLAGWGAPILEKIKELTPKPVTRIINTHSHGDHVSGNPEFPATVEIIAHANTVKNVEAWPPVYGLNNPFPNVIKDAGGKGLPKRTFTDKLTVGSGAEQIDLFYFGRAHTNGDAWVLFPSLRTLVAGDVFPNKGVPIMDKINGGSGVQYAATVRKAVNGVKGVVTIINGHTPAQTTPADMREFADYVSDFVAHVQAAKKAGKTAAQAVAEWKNPEKYKGFSTPNAQAATAYAQVIMDETK